MRFLRRAVEEIVAAQARRAGRAALGAAAAMALAAAGVFTLFAALGFVAFGVFVSLEGLIPAWAAGLAVAAVMGLCAGAAFYAALRLVGRGGRRASKQTEGTGGDDGAPRGAGADELGRALGRAVAESGVRGSDLAIAALVLGLVMGVREGRGRKKEESD